MASAVVVPNDSISASRWRAPGDQFVFARQPRRIDGLDDAAARRGDLGIARAGEASPELVAAIAGKDQMRMWIDEAGHDGAAVRVDHLRAWAPA